MLPLPPDQWAERMFGCAQLNDKRRTNRLVRVATELTAHTGSSLAASCEGDLAAVEGAYRLIENETVKPEAIADAGFNTTAVDARNSSLLLAIEDTTTLTYNHSVVSQLGNIGGSTNSVTKGFLAHSVLLLDAHTERTIGLLDQQRWIRANDPPRQAKQGKPRSYKQIPYENKESFKWQQASENIEHLLGDHMLRTINVCDREADIFEYVLYKLKHKHRFIVRAAQNRTLIDENKPLFEVLAEAPVLGEYQVNIPQRGGRKARKATIKVRSKTAYA